jgi:hypothetical protein
MTSSKINNAGARTSNSETFEKPRLRRDDAHVRGHRLDDHAGDVVVEFGHDVVRGDDRRRHRRRRNS